MSATPKFRAVAAMILKALDRDAAEGRPVRGEMARELREALAESSPEQMLSREQIENIARHVYRECCLLPGATFQHAAETAVMYTLELIARRQRAPARSWPDHQSGHQHR